MKALILNTGSELKKLLMKKKYLVLTVLGAIICILRIGGNVLVSKITGGEVVIKSNLIMEMVGFVFDILVPLIIFMAVTDLFASEVQEDSMKASLLRPLTRFKVMTSKSLAVFVLGCMVTTCNVCYLVNRSNCIRQQFKKCADNICGISYQYDTAYSDSFNGTAHKYDFKKPDACNAFMYSRVCVL